MTLATHCRVCHASKVPSRRYRHDVWHEVGSVRNASDVGLIRKGVEEIWNVTSRVLHDLHIEEYV